MIATVHLEPTGLHEHFSFRLKRLVLHAGDARGDLEFRCWEKHRKKPFHHQVVNFLFLFLKLLRRLQRGDNGKVVRNLGVVENALVARHHPFVFQYLARRRCVTVFAQSLERLSYRGRVILRQRLGICAWISEYLVALVKCLRNRQRVLRGKSKPPVRIALQRGEVEKQRRGLLTLLAFLGHFPGLASAFASDALRFVLFPNAFSALVRIILRLLEILIKPASLVLAGLGLKRGVHLPVIARDKILDRLFALYHHRQSGRLYAPDGGQEKSTALRVEGGHRARAIDAHQPIRLATAGGGGGQW